MVAISLGKLERRDPKTVWKTEYGDFTPWLAEHLELLGEALDLDLELVRTETAVGDFLCDIEAREVGTNRPVIVENQLGPTDHRHLGQLLTYAGGLDATVVVWISPDIRDEHRKALDWLNRHTDERVDFFGVRLEVLRIDESKPAVQFRPVAFPNKPPVPPPEDVSERGMIYKKFFQALIDELREKHKFTNMKKAPTYSWCNFSSGGSGIHYSAAFTKDGLRTGIELASSSKERNKRIFDWFSANREGIDAELGESLTWERRDLKQASYIWVSRPNTSFRDADEHGDELRRWAVEHLLRLKKVFGPKLRHALAAVDASIASEAA